MWVAASSAAWRWLNSTRERAIAKAFSLDARHPEEGCWRHLAACALTSGVSASEPVNLQHTSLDLRVGEFGRARMRLLATGPVKIFAVNLRKREFPASNRIFALTVVMPETTINGVGRQASSISMTVGRRVFRLALRRTGTGLEAVARREMGKQGSKTQRGPSKPQGITVLMTNQLAGNITDNGIEITSMPSGARLSELQPQPSTAPSDAEAEVDQGGES